MQESYLTKHYKITGKFFPNIHAKKFKQATTLVKMKKPTQSSLLLEIQDIDACVNNKTFNSLNGYLFSSEISDKLINHLQISLKKYSAIISDGFSLFNQDKNIRETSHTSSKRLSTHIETSKEIIINQNKQNLYDNGIGNYLQILKSKKKRESLYKILQSQDLQQSKLTKLSNIEQKLKINENDHRNFTKNISTSIHQSVLTAQTKKQKSSHPSVKSHQTTQNSLSKGGKILLESKNQSINISRMSQMKQKILLKKKVLTEINQTENPQDEVYQLSKYQIRTILQKDSKNLVFIWLPPLAYPQFHGMFTYSNTHKLSICRLKKYLFFKKDLTQRFFNSIIDEISSREGRIIEDIQLTTNKQDFTRIFQPLCWKIRCAQSMDKIKILYNKQIK